MIASLLCLALHAPLQGPALYALEEDRHEWVDELADGETWLLLPLFTHDDRRPRAVPGPRGIELRIASPRGTSLSILDFRVDAIPHGRDERLLRCGEELRLASEIALPRSAARAADGSQRLAHLARLDLAECANETLRISPGPEGHDLILLPTETNGPANWSLGAKSGEGEGGPLFGLCRPGHAVRLDGGLAWELTLGKIGLDRAYHASTRLVSAGEEDRLGMLELRRSTSGEVDWRARRGRGPLRAHVLPSEGRGTKLPTQLFGEAAEDPLVLRDGQLLDLLVEAPEHDQDSVTHTLLIRVLASVTSEPREATAKKTEPARPHFRDVSRESGLAEVHFEGPEEQLDIRPTMGPGACWGDFDGDGLTDLYLVQGGGREGSLVPTNRLMRNLGDGRFQAVAGAENAGAGMGALFFDLEGDGDLDLFVANYGPNALYRNDGAEGFVDVSAKHDLGGDGWSAGVCAADYDRDGDLDLYVTTYLVYDTELMPDVPHYAGYAREDPIEMLPFAFPGGRNHFLVNENGKLEERTEELGLIDEQGRGMQPIFWDFDLDGDQDLYVANDVSMNLLWRNEGDGTFEDISFQTGMDDPRGGMGVATGDVDLDGDADLFLTNWQLEANALYRNNQIIGKRRRTHLGTFQDVTVHARLGRHGVGFTSWGCVLFDADNDGDLDLFVPNGYTSPDYESTDICVGQANQFFLNDGRGRFVDASLEAGSAVTAPLASRAAAVCDYDRDGRLDLFVTNNNGPYQLLRNEFESRGHWLGIELKGAGGNTQAVGARVEITADGLTHTREVAAGGGYLAGHATGLHFGLGAVEAIEALRVHWPSGVTTSHAVESLDRWMTITEPTREEEK